MPWKAKSYDEATQVMKAALDNGANFWNASQHYGLPHANSLHMLNYYFTKYPEDADKVVLSVKGAYDAATASPDGSPAGLRKSVEECLRVLDGKKSIDIFECARVDPKVPIETTVAALAEFVKAKQIGGIGLSEVKGETIRRAHAVHPIAGVEIELSLFSTEPLENGIGAACAELGIPIVAYSPLARGWLTGGIRKLEDLPENDHRRMFPRFQPAVFASNLKLVEEVEKVSKRKGCTLAQAAIAWLRAQSGRGKNPMIVSIPGATTVTRVQENSAADIALSESDLADIQTALNQIPIQGGRYPTVHEKLLNM